MTKSTAIWDHGLLGIGKGISFPAGNALGVLHCAQIEHEDITEWISWMLWDIISVVIQSSGTELLLLRFPRHPPQLQRAV